MIPALDPPLPDPAACLVAHRGWPERYPENTLTGLRAALEAGARYVEFDVQLCADGVPVLLHDADLRRTGGRPEAIAALPGSRVGEMRAGYPRRFGALFRDEPLPTLAQTAALLAAWPHATAFVELKKHSIHRLGAEACVEALTAALAPVRGQCVLISFHAGALRLARARHGWPIGWVFATWSLRSRRIAENLAPEYLFSSLETVPAPPLWPGPWCWGLYHTADPALARHWLTHGVALVETNAIGPMLRELE